MQQPPWKSLKIAEIVQILLNTVDFLSKLNSFLHDFHCLFF